MADKRIIEQTASSEIYNDDWFLKDSVLQGTTKISKDNLIDKIGASKINSIAEDYDSTSTYNKDDFVFYNNKLYRCLADNTTGTWDSEKWEEFDIPTALITTAHNIETAEFTIGTYYSADDLVLKDGKLYQCVVGHNATEWKSQFWRSVTIDEMLGYLSDSIAPEHNPSTVYAVGDLVMHNKALWRCIQAGAGAFVNANWELVTVADLIAEAGQIDDVQVKTTGDYETVVDNKIAKIDLSSVTAYGSVPNLPQAIATFNDGADAPMKSLKVGIEPQQDLHGYDAPWAGGAGKNKFNLTASSTTQNGVTYTPNSDGSVSLSGGTSSDASFHILGQVTLEAGSYTLTGGYNSDIYINIQTPVYYSYGKETGDTFTIESQTTFNVIGRVRANISVPSGAKFYPMIRLATVTDDSFAPYSNICPISGWSEVDVTRCGGNLYAKANNIIITKHIPNGTKVYTQIFGGTFAGASLYGKSNTTDWISLGTISQSKNVITINRDDIIELKISSSAYGDLIRGNSDLMVSFADFDAYESYAGTTYTIDLDGTRYGGKLDVVSGVLTVDRVEKPMPANWTVNTESSTYWLITNTRSDAISVENTDTSIRVISDGFKGISANEMLTKMTTADNINSIALISSNRLFLKVAKADYPTLQDLYSMIQTNNIQVVYELATPIEIQLTPTAVKSLLGQNNIWADTGDINECVYRRDMSSTIDDIIARLEALEG